MAVKPIPDGYPRLSPYLIVDGAAAALEFYMASSARRSGRAWISPTGRSGTPSCNSATRC